MKVTDRELEERGRLLERYQETIQRQVGDLEEMRQEVLDLKIKLIHAWEAEAEWHAIANSLYERV